MAVGWLRHGALNAETMRQPTAAHPDGRARASAPPATVNLEADITLEDVEDLVLTRMHVPRWTKDAFAPGEGVVLGKDREATLGEHRDHRDPFVSERRPNERDIHCPFMQPRPRLIQTGIRHDQLHLGVQLGEPTHRLPSQRDHRRRRERPTRKVPPGDAPMSIELTDGGVQRLQNGASCGSNNSPASVSRTRRSDPLKELRTQPALEPTIRPRQQYNAIR